MKIKKFNEVNESKLIYSWRTGNVTPEEMKEIYFEFGIDLHEVPNTLQEQINDLIREIVRLRKNKTEIL